MIKFPAVVKNTSMEDKRGRDVRYTYGCYTQIEPDGVSAAFESADRRLLYWGVAGRLWK